jgi:hypothetical protein
MILLLAVLPSCLVWPQDKLSSSWRILGVGSEDEPKETEVRPLQLDLKGFPSL